MAKNNNYVESKILDFIVIGFKWLKKIIA
jgi:hypothetical protein